MVSIFSPSKVCSLILNLWLQQARGIKNCCQKKSRNWCLGYRELEKKRCKKLWCFRKKSKVSSLFLKYLFPFRFPFLFILLDHFYWCIIVVLLCDLSVWVCLCVRVRASGWNWRIVSVSWSSLGLYRKQQ